MDRDVFSADGAPSLESESSKPSPKHAEGAVCATWVRCGRLWCRCMHGGPKHGPYYARYWWQEGRRYKRYVRREDAEQIARACSERRQAERERRAASEAAREEWREKRALVRMVEYGRY
jgi:hypothetical protein